MAFQRAALGALLLAIPVATAAQTAPSTALVATHRVAYFEVAPAEAGRTADILKTYRDAVRSAAGLLRIDVLQQIGRPSFFAVAEKWRDGAALQAHLDSRENMMLRTSLQTVIISPVDERLLAPVAAQAMAGAPPADSIFVLTHADSIDRSGVVPTMLQELATAARRENGNVAFEVTVQPNRTNHFTLLEIWSTQMARDAHALAETTKTFRMAFGPLSGALYDERMYRAVR